MKLNSKNNQGNHTMKARLDWYSDSDTASYRLLLPAIIALCTSHALNFSYTMTPWFVYQQLRTVCVSALFISVVGPCLRAPKMGTWPNTSNSTEERKKEVESLRPVKRMKTKLTRLRILREVSFLPVYSTGSWVFLPGTKIHFARKNRHMRI